jgi:hypothetical protein
MAADSFQFPFLCLFLNQLFVSCLHISTFPKGGRNMWRCRLDHNQIRHIWTRHIWQNPTAVCVVFFCIHCELCRRFYYSVILSPNNLKFSSRYLDCSLLFGNENLFPQFFWSLFYRKSFFCLDTVAVFEIETRMSKQNSHERT